MQFLLNFLYIFQVFVDIVAACNFFLESAEKNELFKIKLWVYFFNFRGKTVFSFSKNVYRVAHLYTLVSVGKTT